MLSRFNLLLLFVTAAFFSALAPAHAGHWTVSYTYSATSVGSISPNPNLSGTGPTLPEFYDGFSIGPSSSGSYSHTLTVTATLTWGADSPQEVPPDKVTFVEQGHAWGFGMTHTIPAQNGLVDPKPTADDGLGDANTPTNTDNTRADASSEGGQPTQKPWASTITLPTRTLTFSFTHDAANSVGGSGNSWLSYQVIIVSPSLSGYSTHCAPTLGGSDPNWDPMHPRYFSGTGCQASGSAVAASGNVAHAQLCIGENGSDTVVNEYFDGGVPGVPSTPSVALNAMFDSTHFKDGAKIKITLKVWDTNGGHYEVEVTGPAKNRAYILANQERDPQTAQTSYAIEAFKEMDYTALGPALDHKQVVLQRLPHNTAFFTLSHGNEGDFTDSYYSPAPDAEYDPNVSVEWQDITTALSPENASNPNYNPDLAPYNFVYLDSCEGAGYTSHPVNDQLANAFGIYQGSNDRAWLGWHNEVFNVSYEFQTWNERLWNDLVKGDSVLVSVLQSCLLGEPQGELVHGVEVSADVRPAVVGDDRTKLHGVYLGEGANQWLRPLP